MAYNADEDGMEVRKQWKSHACKEQICNSPSTDGQIVSALHTISWLFCSFQHGGT